MKLLALLLLLVCFTQSALAQCACMGGAAVGGLTPIGGTVNIGVMREGFGRASIYSRLGTGNATFSGDHRVEDGPVTAYHTYYVGLLLGYGISNRLTVESELGYYPRKTQEFTLQTATGSGFSHVMLAGKVNVYNDVARELEISAGAGVRFPLGLNKENLPQHVLPSSGGHGLLLTGFVHKGWNDDGFRLILIHRSDFSAVNSLEYRYGAGFHTSLIAGKTLSTRLIGLLEIRHEYRNRDEFLDVLMGDTGGTVLLASPQINLLLGDVNIAALFDYPMYRNYNGRQLANDYAFAVNVTWQAQLTGD